MERLDQEWTWFLGKPEPAESPKKLFISKHKTPLLLDYSLKAPESWWEDWPTLNWQDAKGMKSSIDPVKMLGWARKAGHPDLGTVMEIVKDLRQGCDLGTRGEYLCPSVSTNAPSAYEYGDRVTDTIVDGIKKGIMMGPMKEEQRERDKSEWDYGKAETKWGGQSHIKHVKRRALLCEPGHGK